MSNDRTARYPMGYYTFERAPGSYFVDIWYIIGKKRRLVAADVSESEFLDITTDDAKQRGLI
jgi:hypothetical protein